MWDRDGKWAKALGKKLPIDLLNLQFHKPLIWKKTRKKQNKTKKTAVSMSNNKVKHNK